MFVACFSIAISILQRIRYTAISYSERGNLPEKTALKAYNLLLYFYFLLSFVKQQICKTAIICFLASTLRSHNAKLRKPTCIRMRNIYCNIYCIYNNDNNNTKIYNAHIVKH